MNQQWKSIENTRRRPPFRGPWYWICDKNNRTSLTWLGLLIGIGFIVAYQMTLSTGFTPQVTLAEGAFVLVKAAVIGILLFGAFFAGVYAPAASLRLVEIDVEQLKGTERQNAIGGLMRRSIFAQVFGGFFPAALFLFLHADAPHHFWAAVVSACICTAALIIALSSPRLPVESKWIFYLSILVIGGSALFSLLIFLMICGLKDNPGYLMKAATAWTALTIVSSILSTTRKKELLLSSLAALLLLAFTLAFLEQLQWPFRAIACAVGIAEPRPVTLVVPERICEQMQSALSSVQEVSCDGPNAGTLRDVEVLNSWGSRWLIQLGKGESARTLSFDGNGTVISRASLVNAASAHDKQKFSQTDHH